MSTPPDPQPTTPASQLAAEIAARLVEWGDVASRPTVAKWLMQLCALYTTHKDALWLYVEWQTGDASRIGASYDERAAAKCATRQAAQQENERAMAAISLVNPVLASAMRETYESYSPEAHAERYRADRPARVV